MRKRVTRLALLISALLVAACHAYSQDESGSYRKRFAGHPTELECGRYSPACARVLFEEARYRKQRWTAAGIKTYRYEYEESDHFCRHIYRVHVVDGVAVRKEQIATFEHFHAPEGDPGYCGGNTTEVQPLEVDPRETIDTRFPESDFGGALAGLKFDPVHHYPITVIACGNEDIYCMHAFVLTVTGFSIGG